MRTVKIYSKPRVSLQDMVNTSIALNSYLDVEIVDPTPVWPYALFPSEAMPQSPGKPEPGSNVVQAITGLQHEVLLLRNELNFESWLARENVRQIGRLFEQRITSRNAEVERQNLVSTFIHPSPTLRHTYRAWVAQQVAGEQSANQQFTAKAEGTH